MIVGGLHRGAGAQVLGLTVGRATALVLMVGLLWRLVRYALAFPLWGDEAFLAVNFLTRDWNGLARPLEFDQIAPPGFLWAEWSLVRLFGSSERVVRLVPFLAGSAALVVFRRFCRQVATRRVVLLAVALMACSYFPVRHGNEVKPYTVDLLVSVVLTVLARGVWRDPGSSGRWLALIGAAGVGVWCSYPSAFPAGGVALLLAARGLRARAPRLLAWVLGYSVVLLASWGLMVVLFAGPQARAAAFLSGLETWRGAFPPWARPWRLPWWLLDVHAGSMLAYPYGGKNFGSAATLVLVIVGCAAVWRRPPRRPLLGLLLGPLPLALVAAALQRYPYGTSARVMLYMAPAVCLLSAEGILELGRHVGGLSRGPIIISGLLALVPLGFTIRDARTPYGRPDDVAHRGVARWLARRAGPGDQWVVFNGATPPPRIPDLMLSQWVQRVAEVRFALLSLAPVSTRWEPDPATVAPAPDGRTWFIIHRHGFGPLYPYARLDAYQRALTARLGPPARRLTFALEQASSVEVQVFDPVRLGPTAEPRSPKRPAEIPDL